MSDSSAKKRKLPPQPQTQPQSGNGDANSKNKRKHIKKKRRAEAKRLLDNFKLQQEEHHRQLASLELTDYDQKHLGIRLNMVDLEQGVMEQEEATAQRKEGATKEHETKKPDTDARPVKPLPLGEDINTLTAALLDNGKLVSISTFDGAGSLSLQDWLTLLESMDARASDQKRIRTALNKITDQDLLESILAADEEEKSSWEKFKLVLLGDQAERNEALIEQWDSMEQGNLSVVKYWTHFKGTMRRLRASTPHGDFSVARIRNKFRKGLRPELQLALVLEREGNAESLMKAAKLVETSQKRQNHAPLAAFVQQERTELPQLQQDFLCRSTADQEDMDMEAKRLSVDVLTVFQAISRKNGKCYECGNVGHWRGDSACNGPSRRNGTTIAVIAQGTLLDHTMRHNATLRALNTPARATGSGTAPATDDSQTRHAISFNAVDATSETRVVFRTMPNEIHSSRCIFRTSARATETTDPNAMAETETKNPTLVATTTLSAMAAPLATRILTAETVTGIFAVESKLL